MIRVIRCAAAVFLCAAIGGRAATVSGSVRVASASGGTGSPVEGAKVVLLKVTLDSRGRDSVRTRLDSVITGAQGEYGFAHVDTGRIRLWASKAGFEHLTGHADAAVSRDTGRYTVNIVLPDTTPGRLEVRVLEGSPEGKGMAGATLILGGFGDEEKDTVRTDADGRYTFARLHPTIYTLRARAEGFEGSHLFSDYASPTVRPGGTTSVQFVLWPKDARGRMVGTVRKATNGSAVSGAKVIVSRRVDGKDFITPDTVATGSDGTYAIDGLPAMPGFTLTVEADGHQTAVANDISVVYGQPRNADFLLFPEASGSDLGSASGVVTDSAGLALAGTRMVLNGNESLGDGNYFTAETDSKGRFFFPKVKPGNYHLSAQRDGYRYMQKVSLSIYPGRTLVAYFALRKEPILGVAARDAGGMRLRAGPGSRIVLELPAMPLSGHVRVYDVRGSVRFSRALPAGAAHLDIPWARGRAGYVVIERGGEVHRLAAPALL